ncbi:efflux RND transporter permease subunit [Gimibacter soli]|uniref:Efflux RND transporter permease subunit n=1 Tax=Gimibacter soli TaxID=3024400 RepID=A0AAE9XMH8_9PROT|nr:efflux RND transporter permease subunit [Gimibacter soli]WCL53682.1 efflux RND transporter permease subunit [Gimibacter soli]
MNGLIEWWARNPVASNLLMIGLVIAGILGYNRMERELDPTVLFSGLEIEVSWPGAAPQEVEEQIVMRIEEAISDLDNIEWVQSRASEGFGGIYILADSKVDFTQFMNDVKLRLDSIATFPRDMDQVQVRQWVNRNEFIRVALHGNVSERELKRTAEKLRREMAGLPGLSLVELFGTRREEVSIEVSEEALRRYNLSFAQVADAVRGNSINLSLGSVRTEAGSNSLRTRNMADTEHDFDKIIIRQTEDGGIIRVGDVAKVIDGFEEEEILATLNGEPAVLLQVMTTETMDVVKASASVNKWLKDRSDSLPAGMKMTLWTDAAEDFNGRMTTIVNSAMQGLALVMIVLLLTLRPIVAFWVTVGIATAYAGAFVLLPTVGISLNMLSTFAFLLVIGIVVDDAIVVGESIHTESHRTGGGITAAVLGAQLVAKPVICAVLTTIIAFLPWIFLSGGTSEFTRHITWVVILALTFSLVEALFILPAHLSKLKPREHAAGFSLMQKRISDGIIASAHTFYRPIGDWAVRNRYVTFSAFVVVVMVGFGLLATGWVKTSFMPDIEAEEVVVNVDLPDGTPYSRALEILAKLQTAEQALVDEVEKASGGEKEIVENWYTRSRRDNVIAIVKLAPPEKRDMSAKQAAERLQELIGEIPDAEAVSVQFTLGNNDPDFEISVSHPDLDILREATSDLVTYLRRYSALVNLRDNLRDSSEEIRVHLKPGTEKLGLTLADVSRQVRQAYYGEEVQRLPRDGQDVRVMVRYPLTSRRNMESLKDFRVRTMDGRELPLLAIADLEFAPGISQINRRDRRRASRISGDLTEDIRGQIMEDLEKNFYPDWQKRYPGIKTGAVGQAEGEARFMEEVMSLYTMALFGMYMLLAVVFRSYFQPVVIMIAIPFAVVGAIVGHMATGTTMAIFSYFGIAAAAGVVVNDNLVLLDYFNKLVERGMKPAQAIVEAAVSRFRPILLTTLTTIIGLAPMMLEESIQALFLKPVVIALVFGVAIAFFVTLFCVPALLIIGEDVKAGFRWIGRKLKALFFMLIGRKPATEAQDPVQAE